MDKIKAPEKIDCHRRRVIGAAAITFAAAELGMKAPAKAASGGTDQSKASATQLAP
ncbi:hypothetical protein [Sinorhizobium numidicum]|uniref:hypothetical protein n=1 Tax=Sinorhizobium numidicum TaxID=680248 RepID=UPI003CC8C623